VFARLAPSLSRTVARWRSACLACSPTVGVDGLAVGADAVLPADVAHQRAEARVHALALKENGARARPADLSPAFYMGPYRLYGESNMMQLADPGSWRAGH
jgi:hypothetical protein